MKRTIDQEKEIHILTCSNCLEESPVKTTVDQDQKPTTKREKIHILACSSCLEESLQWAPCKRVKETRLSSIQPVFDHHHHDGHGRDGHDGHDNGHDNYGHDNMMIWCDRSLMENCGTDGKHGNADEYHS